ncbi:KHG/KDPG aldolase [Theobroma cacao]|uniref:KHG/KDPG aldolase n=1 Tax=Theobroma cacao TaxID=3641 RepID=A0A061FSD4_THECC|nr:KHG/KDPG aldolase [Theobroma cacao]
MVFTCTLTCLSGTQSQRLFTWNSVQQHYSALPLPPYPFKPCCSSSSRNHNHTFSLIQDCAVIACLRANSAEQAMEAARAAVNGGIEVLEIVRSTPGVFEVLQALVKEYPTKAFGVGTVLNAEDAKTAMNAGAKFLMSPATVKDIMDDVQDADVLYMPGVMTPTEIFSAYNSGAKIVKIYPVSALGGTRYISAIMKPFPHIPMVASQGITIDSVGDYIAQGAISVVLSDAIFDKEAMGRNNFNAIHQLAKSAALQGKIAVEWKRNCRLTFFPHS